jgi:hypothetical protein
MTTRCKEHSIRIHSRAIERCRILLSQIESGTGNNQGERDSADPFALTRTQAAADAGLYERQRKTALRVAKVDEDEFEATVESATRPKSN